MTSGESVGINCMINYHTGGFTLKGILIRGVSWQLRNNGAAPLLAVLGV